MYCEKCGKQLPEDSSFCQFCGNQITVDKTNVDESDHGGGPNIQKKNKIFLTKISKKAKILIVSIVSAILVVAIIVIASGLYDEYMHKKNRINTPEQTYDQVYNWLIDNGNLVDGDTLIYSETRNGKGLYQLRAYGYNDNNLFAEILIENYSANGKTYNLTVRLDLMPNKLGNTQMYVSLDSTANKAYCTKTYNIDVDAFRKNVPIEGNDVQCSNNTPAFNFTYTDEEKAESLELLEVINDQSYDFLIEILDWLSNEYAPSISLSIKDFGYTSYELK